MPTPLAPVPVLTHRLYFRGSTGKSSKMGYPLQRPIAVGAWKIPMKMVDFQGPFCFNTQMGVPPWLRKASYPLVNVYITIENHHFEWVNPLEMAIFNSYVCLPEVIWYVQCLLSLLLDPWIMALFIADHQELFAWPRGKTWLSWCCKVIFFGIAGCLDLDGWISWLGDLWWSRWRLGEW